MIKHITKCLLTGLATIVPIATLIFFISYLENLFSGIGIKYWSFYFPGLGIILAIVILYALGLATTTFLGNLIIKKIDLLFTQMPLLSKFYKTIKNTLGYNNASNKLFQESVLIDDKENGTQELGLVTSQIKEKNKPTKLVVFIPNSPNPSSGRLIFIKESKVTKLSQTTQETFSTILSIGKGKKSL